MASTNLIGYQKILLFGGSFDPPHRGHVALPQQAAQAIAADVVAYVPAGRAPHKLDKVQTDPSHRLAMLRLALEDGIQAVDTRIVTDEIDRDPDQPSYTVDTLAQIRECIDPRATLRLLIGADQLRIFETWREHERIIELAEPVVMVRPPDSAATLLEALPESQRDAWAPRLLTIDAMDVSSTQIRERIATGQSTGDAICPAVAAYIAKHGLYRD